MRLFTQHKTFFQVCILPAIVLLAGCSWSAPPACDCDESPAQITLEAFHADTIDFRMQNGSGLTVSERLINTNPAPGSIKKFTSKHSWCKSHEYVIGIDDSTSYTVTAIDIGAEDHHDKWGTNWICFLRSCKVDDSICEFPGTNFAYTPGSSCCGSCLFRFQATNSPAQRF